MQERYNKIVDNSNSVRVLRFKNTNEIKEILDYIKQFVFEAIEIEELELKIETPNSAIEFPLELKDEFLTNREFENAFKSLTLGRQRGYIIHFSSAKKSETRSSRIRKVSDKWVWS